MHATVLKYFVEVARCGSIRKAAKNLYVASSAVNRQILNLEQELNTELFVRLPTGIRLNAAGERVLLHIRSTMEDYQDLRMQLDALKGERTGHIKVAALDSLLISVLPATVVDFAQLYPAVTYSVVAVAPQRIAEKVASGECDLGICFLGRAPVGVKSFAAFNFPGGVVMDSMHPLAKKQSVTLEDCKGHSIFRSGGLSTMDSIVSSGMADLWNTLTPIVTCNSTIMVKHLVTSGRGIAFLSKIAFMEEIANGSVAWRPLAFGMSDAMQMAVIVPSTRALPALTYEFVERLVQRMKQMEAQA